MISELHDLNLVILRWAPLPRLDGIQLFAWEASGKVSADPLNSPSRRPHLSQRSKEKFFYYLFIVHYNLPFVEDIRIIVDWTVAQSSVWGMD